MKDGVENPEAKREEEQQEALIRVFPSSESEDEASDKLCKAWKSAERKYLCISMRTLSLQLDVTEFEQAATSAIVGWVKQTGPVYNCVQRSTIIRGHVRKYLLEAESWARTIDLPNNRTEFYPERHMCL